MLITTLMEEFYRKIDTFNRSDEGYMYILFNIYRYDQSERGIKFSKEAYDQISLLFEEFKNEINDLISNLDIIGKGNLKYLSMKLDYNNYYSEREIESMHKNQRNYGGGGDDDGVDNNEDENEEEYNEDIDEEDNNNNNYSYHYEENDENKIGRNVEQGQLDNLEEEIKHSYNDMINQSNRGNMNDILNEEDINVDGNEEDYEVVNTRLK